MKDFFLKMNTRFIFLLKKKKLMKNKESKFICQINYNKINNNALSIHKYSKTD